MIEVFDDHENIIVEKHFPRLVIHAGPHKTGASFLQSEILTTYFDELKQDGYVVPTNKEFPGLFQESKVVANLAIAVQTDQSCLGTFGEIACTECRKSLEPGIQFVKSAWRNSSSVFLSSEEFDRPLNGTKLISLLPPTGSVEIILVYRNLGEWLRSLHRELLTNGGPATGSFVHWLRNTAIPNLPLYAHELQVSQVARQFVNLNVTGLSFKIIRSHNTHERRSFVTEILCDILNAYHACHKSLLILSSPPKAMNERSNSDLINLFKEAEHAGILSKSISVSSSITLQHLEQKFNLIKKVKDVSEDCLEKNFLAMLKKNAVEEVKFIEKLTKISQGTFRDDVLDDHAICSLNVTELLQEYDWVQMIKAIEIHGLEINMIADSTQNLGTTMVY